MSEVVASSVAPYAPKPFWQKIIGKETIPTVWAAITALNWVGGFMAMSALAGAVYHYFDGWLGWLAQWLEPIFNLIPNWTPPFEHYYKTVLILTGVATFGLSGYINKSSSNERLAAKERYFTDVCLVLISIIITSKILSLVSGMYFFDVLKNYLTEDDYILKTLPNYLKFGSATIYIIIIYFALTILLLRGNPKRLRQITLFGILFIALAASSMILEKVFPALMPHYDQLKSEQASENVAE